MDRLLCSFVVFGITVVTLTPFRFASAAVMEDQGQIFGTCCTVEIGSQTTTQTITTGIAGKLVGIQILAEGFPSLDPQIVLAIRDGGVALEGTIRATQTFAIDEDPGDEEEGGGEVLFTWDLDPFNIFYNVGDQFNFELSNPAALFGPYVISGNDSPGYPGGELFLDGGTHPGDSDIAFITFVDPQGVATVPVPPAIFFLGSGLVGLMFRPRLR